MRHGLSEYGCLSKQKKKKMVKVRVISSFLVVDWSTGSRSGDISHKEDYKGLSVIRVKWFFKIPELKNLRFLHLDPDDESARN